VYNCQKTKGENKGKELAVKVFHTTQESVRFEAAQLEAKILSRINHPNIVAFEQMYWEKNNL